MHCAAWNVFVNLLLEGKPAGVQVSLVVHVCLGRMVSSPVMDEFTTAGNHSVIFDGTQMPGGVYFYSLIAGGQRIDVKRMVMLK